MVSMQLIGSQCLEHQAMRAKGYIMRILYTLWLIEVALVLISLVGIIWFDHMILQFMSDLFKVSIIAFLITSLILIFIRRGPI
jgi:hypothetical protein